MLECFILYFKRRLKLEILGKAADDGQGNLFAVDRVHNADDAESQNAEAQEPGNCPPKIERQYHPENINRHRRQEQD